jgi:hypothetical protein
VENHFMVKNNKADLVVKAPAAAAAAAADADPLAALERAAAQYEVYLQLRAVAQSVSDLGTQPSAPYADWNRPIGLVMTSHA